MGKPFASELSQLETTLKWTFKQPLISLKSELLSNPNTPVLIVGSGGSLGACQFAAQLCQTLGIFAKAITPLELLYSQQILAKANVVFVSASGKNNDILFAYKTALKHEPKNIFCICMTPNSPLAKRANKNSISKVYEFEIPAGRDGFLATNSLLAFFLIFYRNLSSDTQRKSQLKDLSTYKADIEEFMQSVDKDYTFTILYGGWGHPVAIDCESKLAEAALADVLLSDYRNFGHGRHHWFAKRKSNSAIVALITPAEKTLAEKTLSLLPKDIPLIRLESSEGTAEDSINLLLEAFYFVEALGKLQSIDPGRPGVPGFGRQLYHLNYQRAYSSTKKTTDDRMRIAISRKTETHSFDSLSEIEKTFWIKAYNRYIKKISSVTFGSIIFDYDGTLCSSSNRFNGIDSDVATYLKSILSSGICMGIATGRGKSVREDLQRILPKKYWPQVIVGYYNCSDIAPMSDANHPIKGKSKSVALELIYQKLLAERFVTEIKPELKPSQITIEIGDKNQWAKVRNALIQFVNQLNQPQIQILESSHSMDIVDQINSNKLNILPRCEELALKLGKSRSSLCIGDRGRWPGNDFQLLSAEYSLSVDEVSSLPNSCWNLSDIGIKNIDATIKYLSWLRTGNEGLKFKLP